MNLSLSSWRYHRIAPGPSGIPESLGPNTLMSDFEARVRPKERGLPIVPLVLAVAALAGLIAAYVRTSPPALTFDVLYARLLIPLAKVLTFLTIGLMVGNLLEALGWTEVLSRWMRPVTRWAHLKDESAAAVIASFVSSTVANSLLAGYLKEGKLDRKEAALTSVVNNGLPVYLTHLPSTFFIAMSLAGTAGVMYLGVTFGAALLRTFGALCVARFTLPEACWLWSPLLPEENAPTRLAERIWKRFRSRIYRLVQYTVPIYTLVFLMSYLGGLAWLRTATAQMLPHGLFSVEAASMVAFSFAGQFAAGMATAGALVHAGTLTASQAALALVAGTILSTPLRAVRYQLPTYAGLFSLRLASQLVLLNQGLRVLTLLLVAGLLAVGA